MNIKLEQYIKERDEALLSLEKEKIIAFCKKYNLPYAKKDKVFWAEVYKCIFHINASSAQQKLNAQCWLIENGFATDIEVEE